MPHSRILALLSTLTLALVLLQSCAGPGTIRKDGLHYVKVGDPMPKAETAELDGHPMTETLTTEAGYSWRVCTLAYESGQVLLESDFQERTRVNRIRVETPELKVKGGLKVGDRWARLLERSSQWQVRPYAEYRLMEATNKKYPGKIFLLRVDGYDYDAPQPDDSEPEVASLPGEAVVVGIVIM